MTDAERTTLRNERELSTTMIQELTSLTHMDGCPQDIKDSVEWVQTIFRAAEARMLMLVLDREGHNAQHNLQDILLFARTIRNRAHEYCHISLTRSILHWVDQLLGRE